MTISVTRSGRRLDLLAPDRARIGASDLAEGLAKINRWAGATQFPFSVGQHSVCVADVMYHETRSPIAALYGLLHDGHEYVTGDILEPTSGALAYECPGYPRAVASLRFRVDTAIHRAAGLDWPRPSHMARLLDLAHARVVATEVRDLLAPNFQPSDFSAAPPLALRITPHLWARAAVSFREALYRYQCEAGLTPLE